MLVIQHIWTRWSKLSRGANSPLRRPRLADAYPLPAMAAEPGAALIHQLRALEREDFAIVEEVEAMRPSEWRQAQWSFGVRLDFIEKAGEAAITLRKDTLRMQTAFPGHLPSPLIALRPGDTAVIEWNGRFGSSLSGSNRSSYYEQHRYWLALVSGPHPRLFLDAAPRKHIDLRAHIY